MELAVLNKVWVAKPENLQYHKFIKIFLELTGDTFKQLAFRIKKNGLREPIVLFRGRILDGRARYRACIEGGVAPHFVKYVGNDPLDFVLSKNRQRATGILSAESERILIRRFQKLGDRLASQKIIEAHMPFIEKMARQRTFIADKARYDALINCGVIGMMEALKTFNISLGHRLTTWARWGILKEMVNYTVSAGVRGMKLTSGELAVFYNLMRARQQLGIYTSAIPEGQLEEVVRLINKEKSVKATLDQVRRVNDYLCTPDLFLDRPVYSDTGKPKLIELPDFATATPEGALRDSAEGTPEGALRDGQTMRAFWGRLDQIPERQAEVIRGRYRDGRPATYEALGESLGVSATRVQQIEKQALANLKKLLENTPRPL